MKTNFSAKTAKVFRTIANNEHKGFNSANKAVLAVWDKAEKQADLAESIEAAKKDGLTASNFSAEFILNNLTGTKWVSNDGKTILTNKKGEMVAKSTWTAGAVIDYVRRANKARLEALAKAEKSSK